MGIEKLTNKIPEGRLTENKNLEKEQKNYQEKSLKIEPEETHLDKKEDEPISDLKNNKEGTQEKIAPVNTKEQFSVEYCEKLFGEKGRNFLIDFIENDIDRREREDLLKYLIEVVYPYFKISIEDEEKFIEETKSQTEIDPNVKRVNINSFKEIRWFLATTFEAACLYGAVKNKEVWTLLRLQKIKNALPILETGISELKVSEEPSYYQKVLENLIEYYSEENITKVVNEVIQKMKEASAILRKKFENNKEDSQLAEYFLSLFTLQNERVAYKNKIIKEIEELEKTFKEKEKELKEKWTKFKMGENTLPLDEIMKEKNDLEEIKKDIDLKKHFINERGDEGETDLKRWITASVEKIKNFLTKLKQINFTLDQIDEKFKHYDIENFSQEEIKKLLNLDDTFYSFTSDSPSYFSIFWKINEIKTKTKEELASLIESNLKRILNDPSIEVPNPTYFKGYVRDRGMYASLMSLLSPSKRESFYRDKVLLYEQKKYEGWEEIFKRKKEKYTRKFSKELFFETLKHQYELVEKEKYVCTNRDIEGTKDILKTGAILPTLILKERNYKSSAWQQVGAVLKANAFYPQEVNFGFKKGTPLVYGTFIGGRGCLKDKELKDGGAPAYGEVFFLIKPEKLRNRVIFADDKSPTQFPILSLDHVPIAKAVHNILKAVKGLKLIPYFNRKNLLDVIFYNVPPYNLDYLGAEIIGEIKLNDIDSINFPADKEKEAEVIKKEFPEYANKIYIRK